MAEITWINHASFILESADGTRLLSDPWLNGSVFCEGWDLITKSHDVDFSTINYIWISHEHPDHFSPKILGNIPAEIKNNITIIFQKTADKRVVNFCKKSGFKVQELILGKFYNISDNFKILCNRVGVTTDSYLYCEVDSKKILNLNDCIVNNSKKAKNIIKNIETDKLDCLLTQFSYANWIGNEDDQELRKKEADEKLRRIKIQCETLKPEYTVPFASFVYFSHEENFYMNDLVNAPEKVLNFIESECPSSPIFLYPGNKWNLENTNKFKGNVSKYENDFSKIEAINKNSFVEIGELTISANKYCDRIKNHFKLLLFLYYQTMRKYLSINIYLWDHKKPFSFSLKNGLNSINLPEEECDIKMSSQSLKFLFDFDYGTDTLLVNGRFRLKKGGVNVLNKTFMLGIIRNSGLNTFSLIFRVLKKKFIY